MEYRSETKYLVRQRDIVLLKARLKNLVKKDAFVREGTTYNIRSIYFDDEDNTFYFENEAGLDERLKVRIRIYDKSPETIKLEIKEKRHGMTKKRVTLISRDLCDRLLKGEYIRASECTDDVLHKLYLEQRMYNLKPKILVEYDREALVYRAGNVRITFDKNLRASKHLNRLFMNNAYSVPLFSEDMQIMEVKYDELLPDFIMGAMEMGNLEETAVSKYYLARLQFREEIL